MNKVELLGHLGGDPEVRYTGDGTPVCNFRIATNDRWTDRNGNKQESTEWHRIVVWGRGAEVCGEHLASGSRVLVNGKLKTREWTDRDGNKKYTTEIHAGPAGVTFLDRKVSTKKSQDIGDELDQINDEPQKQELADYGPPPMSDMDVPF